ncbi:MAG: S-layer homology domain-containing protein [Clostridiales bacterium]|jgi:hypothetical protein|nr:S-layer homology domain-containing protein [Clostridiales bacterium]
MFKRFLATITVLVMAVALLPSMTFAEEELKYTDIGGHWAEAQITEWSDLGILQGNDSEFLPDDEISRAEMAAMIVRIMKYQTPAANTFTDLGQDWYTQDVLRANNAGVIIGYGNGEVHPLSSLTREEAATILGRSMDVVQSSSATEFIDRAKISQFALGYINALASKGILTGANNMINPTENVTRAEVVAMLDRSISGLYGTGGDVTLTADSSIILTADGVTLKDTTIAGDVIITEGVGIGDIILDNVKISGRLIVHGGANVIVKGNSDVAATLVRKAGGIVNLAVQGAAEVGEVRVADNSGSVAISGSVDSIVVGAEVNVTYSDGTAGTVTIEGIGSTFTNKGIVSVLEANNSGEIVNNGTVSKLTASANDVVYDGNAPGVLEVDSSVTYPPVDSNGVLVQARRTGGGGSGGGGGGLPQATPAGTPVVQGPVTSQEMVEGTNPVAAKWEITLTTLLEEGDTVGIRSNYYNDTLEWVAPTPTPIISDQVAALVTELDTLDNGNHYTFAVKSGGSGDTIEVTQNVVEQDSIALIGTAASKFSLSNTVPFDLGTKSVWKASLGAKLQNGDKIDVSATIGVLGSQSVSFTADSTFAALSSQQQAEAIKTALEADSTIASLYDFELSGTQLTATAKNAGTDSITITFTPAATSVATIEDATAFEDAIAIGYKNITVDGNLDLSEEGTFELDDVEVTLANGSETVLPMELDITNGGELKVEEGATLKYVDSLGNTEELIGDNSLVLDEDASITITGTSTGAFNTWTRQLVITGDVVVKSPTELVFAVGETVTISADSTVTIEDGAAYYFLGSTLNVVGTADTSILVIESGAIVDSKASSAPLSTGLYKWNTSQWELQT